MGQVFMYLNAHYMPILCMHIGMEGATGEARKACHGADEKGAKRNALLLRRLK